MLEKLKSELQARKGSTPSAPHQTYTDGRFEVGVSCHKTTDIPVTMDIHQRYGYVEGSGQLCKDCYREIYGKLR